MPVSKAQKPDPEYERSCTKRRYQPDEPFDFKPFTNTKKQFATKRVPAKWQSGRITGPTADRSPCEEIMICRIYYVVVRPAKQFYSSFSVHMDARLSPDIMTPPSASFGDSSRVF